MRVMEPQGWFARLEACAKLKILRAAYRKTGVDCGGGAG